MSSFNIKKPTPSQRLILPLDIPSVSEARDVIADVDGAVSFFKLGYQLLYAGGFELVQELKAAGKQVFIDLKLLDIDNTVKSGIESLKALNPDFITLHAYPHAMRAAVAGRGDSPVSLLGVTVLTSLDDDGLKEAGYKDLRVGDLVIKRAHQAKEIGMDGIVCSPVEASMIRTMVGPELLLVTPGIRPASAASDDQRRVMTPSLAIENGSDYLVVGRPILNAPDRKQVARNIAEEIEAALEKRN